MQTPTEKNDKTVIIEHCTNCKAHKWCTYHNEEKYHEFFTKGDPFSFLKFSHLFY